MGAIKARDDPVEVSGGPDLSAKIYLHILSCIFCQLEFICNQLFEFGLLSVFSAFICYFKELLTPKEGVHSMSRVKLGIIGCGIAARNLHWPALQKLQDKFEIVAVCNHTEPKAREFAEMAGGVPYDLDSRQLLQRPEVEAVDIVLPIELSYPVTRDALSAGKHVITEKPLAKNMEEAGEMLKLAATTPLVTMIAENYRYRPAYLRLKEILDSGALGNVYAAVWNLWFEMKTTNRYAQTRWRIHHQYPGGFVTDGGVHQMAALRMLTGEIVSGAAFARSVNPAIGETDTLSIQFRTDKGVDGLLNLFYTARGISRDEFLLFTTKGTVSVTGGRVILSIPGQDDQVEEVPGDSGYVGEFEDFYNTIRFGSTVRSPFTEGYRDLQVILAAQEAAKQGRGFTIPSAG